MKINAPISLYWKCQLAGWTVAGLYWSYTGLEGNHVSYLQLLLDFIGDVAVCILITHAYRNVALKYNWQQLNLRSLVLRIVPGVLILGFLFMVLIAIKLYLVRILLKPDFPVRFLTFFETARLTLFITGIRLMSIWILAWHLYHYAQREINAVKENARLTIMTKEAQLNNLSAQLNPHFFFNSLNTIKFLVDDNPGSARRAIDLLSDLLRNSLYKKEDKLITLQQEIDLVKDYLELEKLRFEERLQTTIQVDEKLFNLRLPPLCIQTLVENAIKHGIDKRIAGGFIKVSVERENDLITISVQNSGKLQAIGSQEGLGLKNLRERLQLQYNGKAMLSMKEVDDQTVIVSILIPSYE
ncbi:histidine kinase [Niastella vici]|uniref:Histidine kinase n=1 Tax=Niastella vici TaxID=1703345 RepID=A0A1V9FT32_9BACT|nr:histidine kinase [Niastella vici]